MVEKLCGKSTNPSFCANALKSDPRSAIADITTFEQIAINLTKANATDTWNFVNLNAGQNNDPKIKAAYQRCSPLYEDIIAATDDATTSLEALDYRDLDTEGEIGRAHV